MRKIENIEKIINFLINPLTNNKYNFLDVKEEFFKFAKEGEKQFSKKVKDCQTKEEKENLSKYKLYSNDKFDDLKNNFLKKLHDEGIDYCCYCGKSEIIKLKNLKRRTYDIDHFLPRSKYPDLSVNLLNWIPACKSCNSISFKGEKDPLKENKEIFHPYLGFLNIPEGKTLDEKYSFCKNDKKGRKLIYDSYHSNFFNLDELYLSSSSTKEVEKEIFRLQDFLQGQKDISLKSGIDFNYINYLKNDYPTKYPTQEQDILKFSNGKLKKDLIENLKI